MTDLDRDVHLMSILTALVNTLCSRPDVSEYHKNFMVAALSDFQESLSPTETEDAKHLD